jgi:aminobenzoyl-glutamate transport protein
MPETKRRRGALNTFLAIVERGGNALPHPATLFLLMSLLVIVASDVAARAGLEAIHPTKGDVIRPTSLLSLHGLHRILRETVTNFTGFAPLGTVLVAMLGLGVAEASGLIGTGLRLFVLAAPRKLLTLVVVFAGVMSNVGSEIGYVLLVPLAAIIFQAAGRHPIAGMAAAFAGVSGGYSANLLLGTVDPLLSGLTQEAARILDPKARVNPACNYYFMAASTFLITAVGTWVTERVVVPRLGEWRNPEEGASAAKGDELRPLSPHEWHGLLAAAAAAALFAAVLLWGTVPSNGFLRDPETGDLLHSPFMSGIVTIIFLGGAICGLAYGVVARTFRSDSDVMKGVSKSIGSLASYLVLVFFAAQFVAYFNWTNLGLIFAVKGADALKASGLGGVPLLVGFIFLTSVVNLFMGSASAKWALMAPIFVPMLMLLGYAPELTQVAYRIGDSSTNIISPMMSYFALIIAFFQRYEPKAGIGTLVATMLPYTIAFLVTWCLFFAGWVALGLPLGPGA